MTLRAPAVRVFGPLGAHNACSASCTFGVMPESPPNYPSDAYGGHDRATNQPETLLTAG